MPNRQDTDQFIIGYANGKIRGGWDVALFNGLLVLRIAYSLKPFFECCRCTKGSCPVCVPGLCKLFPVGKYCVFSLFSRLYQNKRICLAIHRASIARGFATRDGAICAYLHGSRQPGLRDHTPTSTIAASFDGQPPEAFELLLPAGVDLLVLNHAPLELAGRVAVHGKLLFEGDASARVTWEATTRKIYFGELPRITRAREEFAETVLRRGG
jgi:uncharacterized protein